ncbi:glycosyltransferase family 8 protein [Catellatospora tritici]|uniref:glycosyltransferase family 8 protein n=1 Tax=Catellatospora tritici TaxID=2851566 RepID=UPI001C2D5B00|nr:glycosyltransferase family 8 protein [Catellatospora tritici]MBV1850280.1 glycosyltransferase family 8 protein [Catellatospora tritici]
MDIAFAVDETYAEHAQVAMESVLECHPGRDGIVFWLLTTDDVAKTRSGHLGRQLDGRAELRLLTCGDEFRSLPVAEPDWLDYLSPGMYLRLLLPELVGDGPRRLLYLDADTAACGDLAPLWTVPLDEQLVPLDEQLVPLHEQLVLGAVRDAYNPTLDAQGGIPGAGPDVDGGAAYFNSGMLLINLAAWRAQDVTGRCLDYLAANASRLRFPDQDALNLAASGRWLRLPHRWNHMRSYDLEPGPDAPWPDTDVRIMHFAGRRKPWTEGFRPGHRLARYRRLAAAVAAYA